jgi:2-aminoethylphosphonate-pyruvate transaminase
MGLRVKMKLLTPGPVMTSDSVKRSMMHADIPHRRQTFEAYLEQNRVNLKKIFKADDQYTVVLVSGSGTAANETALSSIIKENEEVLLISNGVFGDRLDEILSCYKYNTHKLEFAWGQPPDLHTIEEALVENENIHWVCMVFHETSTGMINPVHEVGNLLKKYDRKYFVDCVSALGGEDVNIVRDNIDVATASANKAISGPTGISIVCAKRSSVPELGEEVPRRNIYLNLQNFIQWAEQKKQTPNTPAVTMFIALDAALRELLDEGLENRIKRYRTCVKIIRHGVRDLGLRTLLSDEQSSNTVTSVFLPEGEKLSNFIDEVEKRGFVLYPGKGPFLDQNMFQIANMGWISQEDCHALLKVLRELLTSANSKTYR